MNRILLFLFLCVATNTTAQRYIDLELLPLKYSETGASMKEMQAEDTLFTAGVVRYYFEWRVVNHGPDTLKSGDTLKIYSAYPAPDFILQKLLHIEVVFDIDSANILAVGDTGVYMLPGKWSMLDPSSAVTVFGFSMVNWCDTAWFKAADTNQQIADTVTTNNGSCRNITRIVWGNIEEALNEQGSFYLYPNPAHSRVQLIYDFEYDGVSTVHIMGLSGNIVYTKELGKLNGRQEVLLELPDVPPGMYLLQLQTGDEKLTRQLLIE